MAKIKFSAAVSAASGKIGGMVFSNNRGGAYIRTQRKVVNANTPSQNVARASLAFVSNAWRSLTQTQREAFKEAALLSIRQVRDQFGDSRSLTGMQYFTKVNLLLQTLTPGVLLSTPGAPVTYPNLEKITAQIDSGLGNSVQLSFTIPDEIDPEDFSYVIKATAPTPAGQTPRQPKIIGVSTRTADFAQPTTTITGQEVVMDFDANNVAEIIGNLQPGFFVSFELSPLNANDPWNTIRQDFASVPIIAT